MSKNFTLAVQASIIILIRRWAESFSGQGTDYVSFSIVLVTYLKELDPHLWSYTDFLNKNRVTVVNASSHSDKWYTLDSTWTRRFLQEAVGLELMSTGDIKKMVIMFWYSWRKGASCQVSTWIWRFSVISLSQVVVGKLLCKSPHALGASAIFLVPTIRDSPCSIPVWLLEVKVMKCAIL